MQMVFLPVEGAISRLAPMNEAETAEREMRGRRIHASRDTLGKESRWTSSTNTVFDGTYREILRAARAEGQRKRGLMAPLSSHIKKCCPRIA